MARTGINISYKKRPSPHVFFPIRNNHPGQMLVQNWLGLTKEFLKAPSFSFLICMYLTLKGLNTSTGKLVCFFHCHFSKCYCVLKWFVLKKNKCQIQGAATSLLSEQTHLHRISQTFCLYSAFCVNVQLTCLVSFSFFFSEKNKADKV